MMTTLSELINNYGATGYIRYDRGQGSAGPAWIEWDEDDANAGVEMTEKTSKKLVKIAKDVLAHYPDTDIIFVSDWIDGGNDYEYRILF